MWRPSTRDHLCGNPNCFRMPACPQPQRCALCHPPCKRMPPYDPYIPWHVRLGLHAHPCRRLHFARASCTLNLYIAWFLQTLLEYAPGSKHQHDISFLSKSHFDAQVQWSEGFGVIHPSNSLCASKSVPRSRRWARQAAPADYPKREQAAQCTLQDEPRAEQREQ